ncbi:MAG: LuxR C-terminal-related transcriptional regulator [Actinomycetota bacterium]|nr:LuxR C-terminal-related transcriptional regulator [Actinomycetota bacterium]
MHDDDTSRAIGLAQSLLETYGYRQEALLLARLPAGCPCGQPPRPAGAPLTPREAEVLGLVVAGLTNGQAARRLGISDGTVRKHLEHAYGKLGVDNRVSAAMLAAARVPAQRRQSG